MKDGTVRRRALSLAFSSLLIAAATAAPASTQPQSGAPEAGAPSVRSGKYLITLRIPSDGIYADEETDLEFRLVDASEDDPVLGSPGVLRATIDSLIAMPAMPGMPMQAEVAHAEGVPGDYGIHPVFPHGGKYLLTLKISPPGGEPFTVGFPLDVKDGDPNRPPRPKPFELRVEVKPSTPVAGEPARFVLQVHDRAANAPVTGFDVAHEKLLHLMVIREDLGVFAHEHPELEKNGEFTLEYTFPAEGRYRLFADVAPKGRGSQVLTADVTVKAGKKAVAVPRYVLDGPMPPAASTSEGLKGTIAFEPASPVSGAPNVVTLRVADAASGAPVTDLQPYLGAMGHMVLVHQDGTTYVHSHPDEALANVGRNGVVPFLARFAKPGWYRCWAQVQSGGKVATFAFPVKVEAGR